MASYYSQNYGNSSYTSTGRRPGYQTSHTYGTSDMADQSFVLSSPCGSQGTYSEANTMSRHGEYYTSEPLSRYGSSEGSCHAPSTPASPMSNSLFAIQGVSYTTMSNPMNMDTTLECDDDYDNDCDDGLRKMGTSPTVTFSDLRSYHGPLMPASPMGGNLFAAQDFTYTPMSAALNIDATASYGYDYDPDCDVDVKKDMSASPETSFTIPRSHDSPEEKRPRAASNTSRDYPIVCLHADCNSKPFKRRADFDRHYKHRHAPDSRKEAYFCDYGRCTRRREPFHRRDHFRDHLRDFHKEDIEKRGGVIKEEWLEGRYVPETWWRCPRCLKRIYIEGHGYDCPSCKTSCQPKRKEARLRD